MTLRSNLRRIIGVAGMLTAAGCIIPVTPALARPADDEAAAAQAELAAARLDATRAEARLSLATARAAVLEQRWDVAEAEGRRALNALRSLPATDGVTDQTLMAEGILARARAGRIAAARPATPSSSTGAAPHSGTAVAGSGPVTDMTPLNPPSARRPASPRPSSTANRAMPDRPAPRSYAPAAPVDDIDDLDFNRDADATPVSFRDQAGQRDAVNDDEARLLNDVDAARRVPLKGDQWVSYPPDWLQKAARRSREYPGGLIARSDSWTDAQGREWYLGVYDVSDLIYVAPDFVPQVQMNPVVAFRTWQDRFNLNFNLAGFGNFAFNDPDRYLLLSRYFGGVDDLMWRGPKYSVERQRQIQEMVELLIGDLSQQATVISVPPVQPPP
jgi:hypothetical protein